MKFGDLLKLDASLSSRFRVAEKPGLLRSVAMVFAHSGDSWFWGVVLIVLWFWGSDYWKSRAITLVFSVAITAVLVLVMKFSVKRKRPEGDWGGIYRSTDPHSFPSGHAARSFMLAVVVIGLGPAWLGIVLAIWAPLVGAARVAMGVHFISDVLVGALLGILMGCINLSLIPAGLALFSKLT